MTMKGTVIDTNTLLYGVRYCALIQTPHSLPWELRIIYTRNEGITVKTAKTGNNNMKFTFIFIFIFITNLSFGQVSERFLNALEQVESRGNANAVGDNGRAIGCLQIWQAVVIDVNRIAGTNYKHTDAFNRVKARAMARIYLNHYAGAQRISRDPTDQDYARIWNCGPSGHRKSATLGYWVKVKKELAKL